MDTAYKTNDISGVVELDRAHVWHHMLQHKALETADPFIVVEGRGLTVWDARGREYLDAVSGGVWTVNVGYGRESIADAMRDQAVRMNYFAGSAGTIPGAQLARRLLGLMPGLDRIYLANSGSEANEKVFKMVRQISARHRGGRKSKILFRDRDYHGSSIATLAAGGQPERADEYGPLPEGFVKVPHCLEYRRQWDADDYGRRAADAIEEVILREGPDTIGLLCLEPVTAGGGIITPPEGYWPRVQEICRKYDILLHIDEVVCGLGRTGTWFGYQNYGIEPDFVTMAKGLGSGYAAISAVATTNAIFDLFKDETDPMAHFRDISTFGGCTVGPAAALETIDIIEREGLLQNSRRMGERLHQGLRALQDRHAVIGDVRGIGLLQGAELVRDRDTKEPVSEALVTRVLAEAKSEGVIIGAMNRSMKGLNTTLCLAPALIATEADIDRILSAIGTGLSRVFPA
ncbi:aminotransferase family protein [Chachezhania sediminis]|uniref:aminotransferase family protein n=1 Tax=Chachezhania sediminis TaxID=2599291 RepID=UPI00131B2431|nr:aminotransferase class III-fold pyridoxal phosphate-dependent enzyme [Chachezhania sediminis]